MSSNKIIKKEVNELKTKELLAELNNELNTNDKNLVVNVNVEDIGKYLQEQGLIVKVHAGRIRTIPGTNIKAFGINIKNKIKDEVVADFVENHISSGKIYFLPTKIEANLIKLENGLRQKQRALSLGYDNSFMPIKSYRKFKTEYFDKYQKEFFALRDEILDKWDEIVAEFEKALEATLTFFGSDEKEQIYRNAIANIPSKEVFKERFYMSLSLNAFPVMNNINLFSEEIQNDMKNGLSNDTLSLVYEILINSLNDAFTTVCRLLNKEEILPKTWSGINNCISRLEEKNILDNASVKEIIQDLRELYFNRDKDVNVLLEEYIEPILAKIFGYSKDLGYADKIDFSLCNYSQSELSSYYSILKK